MADWAGIEQLYLNPSRPRGPLPEVSAALKRLVEAHGPIDPVVVRPHGTQLRNPVQCRDMARRAACRVARGPGRHPRRHHRRGRRGDPGADECSRALRTRLRRRTSSRRTSIDCALASGGFVTERSLALRAYARQVPHSHLPHPAPAEASGASSASRCPRRALGRPCPGARDAEGRATPGAPGRENHPTAAFGARDRGGGAGTSDQPHTDRPASARRIDLQCRSRCPATRDGTLGDAGEHHAGRHRERASRRPLRKRSRSSAGRARTARLRRGVIGPDRREHRAPSGRPDHHGEWMTPRRCSRSVQGAHPIHTVPPTEHYEPCGGRGAAP